MSKVSFFLKNTGTEEPQIMLRASHRSEHTTFYTGFRLMRKYWKGDRCSIPEVDRVIQKQRSECEAIMRELQFEFGDDFTLAQLRAKFKPKKERSESLIAVSREYLSAKVDFSTGTHNTYAALKNHLLKFSPDVLVSEINQRYYEQFKAYLWKNGLTNNSAWKLLSKVRAVMHWAKGVGHEVGEGFAKFDIEQSEKEVIFLSESELEQIRNVELPEQLEKSRDMFLFSCYTGMRHSDIMNWNQNVKGDFIYVTQIKTKDPAIIPLNRHSRAILEKWGSPPKVVNQQVNRELKVIALRAGLNEHVRQVRFRGKERLEVVRPKHELLTFHAGRATFIMKLVRAGISAEIIMRATGHVDWKSFKRYVGVNEEMLKEVSERVFG
jgi:site-specific recombinase XerD